MNPQLDPATVTSIATQAVSSLPAWAKDDAYGDIIVTLYARHHTVGPLTDTQLASIASTTARSSLRQQTYLAGPWQNRVAYTNGVRNVQRIGTNPIYEQSPTEPPANPSIIETVIEQLVKRGMNRIQLETAIDTLLTNATSRTHKRRARIHDTPILMLCEQSGLTPRQCNTLKTLLIGQSGHGNKPATPGIITRNHTNPNIINHPTTQLLLDEIVKPTGPRLINPWQTPKNETMPEQ